MLQVCPDSVLLEDYSVPVCPDVVLLEDAMRRPTADQTTTTTTTTFDAADETVGDAAASTEDAQDAPTSAPPSSEAVMAALRYRLEAKRLLRGFVRDCQQRVAELDAEAMGIQTDVVAWPEVASDLGVIW